MSIGGSAQIQPFTDISCTNVFAIPRSGVLFVLQKTAPTMYCQFIVIFKFRFLRKLKPVMRGSRPFLSTYNHGTQREHLSSLIKTGVGSSCWVIPIRQGFPVVRIYRAIATIGWYAMRYSARVHLKTFCPSEAPSVTAKKRVLNRIF